MSDVTFTDQNFEQEALKSNVPVVIDFWAPWCAPCRIVSPTIEQLATEYKDKVKVGKMNVDDNPNVAAQYGIMSIPTVMIVKDGNAVKSVIGARSKEDYKREIDEVLSS